MQRTKVLWVLPLTMLVLLGATGIHAMARAKNTAPPPPVIVWVDSQELLKSKPLHAKGVRKLQDAEERIRMQRQELEDERARLKRLIDILEPGSPEARQAMRELFEVAVNSQALAEFEELKRATLRMEMIKSVYDRARTEAAKFAAANGYDYVLLSDAAIAMEPGAPAAVTYDFLNRRILYASPEYDVTDDFVQWLVRN